MVIANPIYDVVFKKMMENEKVAKFFIGTLLELSIETIEVKPQEYTYEGEFDFTNPKDVEKYEARIRERHSIWVYRLDFIATIKTENGEYKKVLIEIQKAKNQIDLMRFRNYLAEQYKKEDIVNNEKVILPITTIYILGFKLPEINTPCLKVERNYKDLSNKTTLLTKSDFVEKLTHDSYIVQVERIDNKYQTKLDKLLSIFEQSNFVDDKKIIKEFNHKVDIEEMKIATDILHHSGTNPVEKKKIEDEQEAIRTINALFEDEKKKYLKELTEKDIALGKKDRELGKKDKELEEKDKQIAELLKKLNQNK
ncbi:MAG: hypothetical protein EAZ51_05275 [Sphingobacteriales bacterium]|nr:MAG: hypothetical protein EAZ64_02990 [Sphingobacteriales bacterium]TAF80864.1 MAG: hypothetical protein EAZ51_05275 [Sphingobacteriales bacterium]